ncbi:MAG TPA: hypothetical protein VFB80_19435 [Pirellulaceae bacterium]|nr:hypothetical protein [Pirellulaceae bacterium]
MRRMRYRPRLCFGIAVIVISMMPALRLRADEVPPLTNEELGTQQQQALLLALAGDPYGHRAADHCRAGWPMLIRHHAIPSNTRHYGGYWIGGGVPLFGDSPSLVEGTFGWDYFGAMNKWIDLSWSHGRRYQGGGGAYRTDGPKLPK